MIDELLIDVLGTSELWNSFRAMAAAASWSTVMVFHIGHVEDVIEELQRRAFLCAR